MGILSRLIRRATSPGAYVAGLTAAAIYAGVKRAAKSSSIKMRPSRKKR